jgi:large subunit ribosomal protein L10
MPNRINQLLHKEYTSAFQAKPDVISVGYEGLSVKGIDTLRNRLVELGYDMLFVKNNVLRIAFTDLGCKDLTPILTGQSALAFGGEDPVALARFLVGFQKEFKELKIHGALVEDTILDENGVKSLSKSPTKTELKSQIVGQILGPGGKVVAAALGPGSTIAGQLKSLIEKLEGGDAA